MKLQYEFTFDTGKFKFSRYLCFIPLLKLPPLGRKSFVIGMVTPYLKLNLMSWVDLV